MWEIILQGCLTFLVVVLSVSWFIKRDEIIKVKTEIAVLNFILTSLIKDVKELEKEAAKTKGFFDGVTKDLDKDKEKK